MTLTINDEVYERLHRAAMKRHVTPGELLRDYAIAMLQAEEERQREGECSARRFRALVRSTSCRIGPRTWPRDDLHER